MMTRSSLMKVMLVVLLLLNILVPVSMAQGSVKAQIAFVLDGSRSIRPGEFDAMKIGLSNAIVEKIGDHPERAGRVEICVVQFGVDGVPGQTVVEINPIVVTADNKGQLRNRIRNIDQGSGDTPTAAGIRSAISLLTASPNFGVAGRRIINIVTDGQPYDPTSFPDDTPGDATRSRQDALDAAAEARAAGIEELDAEAIGALGDRPWQLEFFQSLAYPAPAVTYGLGDTPPGIGQGFVYIVGDSYDFRPPVEQKLLAPFPTPTPTNTSTNTPTSTATSTPMPTSTFTPGPTDTPTATSTPTYTPSPGPSSTPTLTPAVSLTPTPSPTPVAVPEGDSGMLLMLGLIVLLAYGGLKYSQQQTGRRL